MYIYFGIVKKYQPERGFGFLTHPLALGPNKDIFFHITNVKKSHEDIAERLALYDDTDNICFWYISETTRKGEQLLSILEPQEVFNLDQVNPSEFREKTEFIWRNIDRPIPFWLNEVTIGLFGSNGKDELKLERERLIQRRHEELETQRKERERLRKVEEERAQIERDKRTEERKRQEEEKVKAIEQAKEERKRQQQERERKQSIEEYEFELLVAEMQAKGFSKSHEVSHYIVDNRLGAKYQNISGVLDMANSTSSWKFKGGFPPQVYARLCERLNLGNKRTDARVTGFTSFKDLKE